MRDPVRIVAGTHTLERYRSQLLIQWRSFDVDVELIHHSGDRGVLFSHGDQGGGYALYVIHAASPLLGDAPAGILALADLLGDLLAAVGGARGVGIAKPGRALGLVPALLLDPLAHPSALADLFDVQRITPLLLFLLRGITPVLVAFRRGGACLRRLRGLGLALLPALFVLLLARGAEIVAVVIAATLLRAGGCDAADREQRAQQCGGQGADGGKAVHLVVSSWRDRFAPDACSWRLHG